MRGRAQLLNWRMTNILPPVMSQVGKRGYALAYAKFVIPGTRWTWYATEFDPDKEVFFGLVVGLDTKLDYFTLADLQNAAIKVPMRTIRRGVTYGSFTVFVERDPRFQPTRLRDLPETPQWLKEDE